MFECDKCGECCKNLDKSDIYKDLHNGDGVCFYLNENICSIYENRPFLCRVEEGYEIFKIELSYEKYINLNYKYCSELKKSRGK